MSERPLESIVDQWHIMDGGAPGQTDGWYVVRPGGGLCGPFTEEEAERQLPLLRSAYPARGPLLDEQGCPMSLFGFPIYVDPDLTEGEWKLAEQIQPLTEKSLRDVYEALFGKPPSDG